MLMILGKTQLMRLFRTRVAQLGEGSRGLAARSRGLFRIRRAPELHRRHLLRHVGHLGRSDGGLARRRGRRRLAVGW